MKTLYLDLFSGISGDMFIGALVDLGVDPATLETGADQAGTGWLSPSLHRAQKGSIAGTKFDVHVSDDHHDHPDSHGDDHSTTTTNKGIITMATLGRRTTAMTTSGTFQKSNS